MKKTQIPANIKNKISSCSTETSETIVFIILPFIYLALVKTKQFSTKYNKHEKLNLPTEVPGTNLNQNVQSAGKHMSVLDLLLIG